MSKLLSKKDKLFDDDDDDDLEYDPAVDDPEDEQEETHKEPVVEDDDSLEEIEEPKEQEQISHQEEVKQETKQEVKQEIEETKEAYPDQENVDLDQLEEVKHEPVSSEFVPQTTMSNFIPPEDDDAENQIFFVGEPIKGAKVTYQVKGTDQLGDFEGQRRFNDFFSLRDAFVKRWPGCYIPPMPPKKAVGNKDLKFLEDRRYYLERFLRVVGKYDFLINSEEFKTFARPSTQDIGKLINALPKTTSDSLLERIRESLKTEEAKDLESVRSAQETINDFRAFGKRVLATLNQIRDSLRPMASIKEQHIMNYRKIILTSAGFLDILSKYEDSNLSLYVDHNTSKLIISDTNNPEIKDRVQEMTGFMKNPFNEMYQWAKGEAYDLAALMEAIDQRDQLESMKSRLEKQKKSDAGSLDKLSAGKSTMKTMFKGQSGKQNEITNLQNHIAQSEKDVENYEIITKIMTQYLSDTVIPRFKGEKISGYYKVLGKFSSFETNNSKLAAQFWQGILSNTNLKNF